MRLWVKRGLKNNAPSESPPATPQIELSALPRAVSYQSALLQIPEVAIIKTADLQNFYWLASQLCGRRPGADHARRARPPAQQRMISTYIIYVDGAVEEARVDAPERTAKLPREPTTEERERGTRHADTSLSDPGAGHA